MKIDLFNGDCLIEMDKLIKEGVRVDAIITDPPYGTTACKWDSIIPFDEMWERLNKLIKPNGAIVLFGSEPFSSALRMSNIKNYKYDWIWNKNRSGSFILAKKRPMQYHELISVFYKKQCNYYPQFREYADGSNVKKLGNRIIPLGKKSNKLQGLVSYGAQFNKERGAYPKMTIDFRTVKEGKVHPTQKPVPLMEYLIKTYTNENETVLDFTTGSGTTGVACKNTNREFIGIEKNEDYFNIAKSRIENYIVQTELFKGEK